MKTKKCSRCKVEKPYDLEHFYRDTNSKWGLKCACKKCEIRATQRWRAKNLDKEKNAYFIRTYGITLDDVLDLIERQGGGCGLCGEPFENNRYHIDHCHETGAVRGALHPTCNTMIAHAKEDTNLLRHGIRYIESFVVVKGR